MPICACGRLPINQEGAVALLARPVSNYKCTLLRGAAEQNEKSAGSPGVPCRATVGGGDMQSLCHKFKRAFDGVYLYNSV